MLQIPSCGSCKWGEYHSHVLFSIVKLLVWMSDVKTFFKSEQWLVFFGVGCVKRFHTMRRLCTLYNLYWLWWLNAHCVDDDDGQWSALESLRRVNWKPVITGPLQKTSALETSDNWKGYHYSDDNSNQWISDSLVSLVFYHCFFQTHYIITDIISDVVYISLYILGSKW